MSEQCTSNGATMAMVYIAHNVQCIVSVVVVVKPAALTFREHLWDAVTLLNYNMKLTSSIPELFPIPITYVTDNLRRRVETSLASHTLRRERKGLVTLQLPSCRRGTQLSTIAVR